MQSAISRLQKIKDGEKSQIIMSAYGSSTSLPIGENDFTDDSMLSGSAVEILQSAHVFLPIKNFCKIMVEKYPQAIPIHIIDQHSYLLRRLKKMDNKLVTFRNVKGNVFIGLSHNKFGA